MMKSFCNRSSSYRSCEISRLTSTTRITSCIRVGQRTVTSRNSSSRLPPKSKLDKAETARPLTTTLSNPRVKHLALRNPSRTTKKRMSMKRIAITQRATKRWAVVNLMIIIIINEDINLKSFRESHSVNQPIGTRKTTSLTMKTNMDNSPDTPILGRRESSKLLPRVGAI